MEVVKTPPVLSGISPEEMQERDNAAESADGTNVAEEPREGDGAAPSRHGIPFERREAHAGSEWSPRTQWRALDADVIVRAQFDMGSKKVGTIQTGGVVHQTGPEMVTDKSIVCMPVEFSDEFGVLVQGWVTRTAEAAGGPAFFRLLGRDGGPDHGKLVLEAVKSCNAGSLHKLLAGLGSSMTWAPPLDNVLHLAVQHGCLSAESLDVVKCLLAHGAPVNPRVDFDSHTPLHIAALDDNEELAMVLVAAGADLDADDIDGRTPAQIARKQAECNFDKGKASSPESLVATFLDRYAALPKYMLTVSALDTEDDGCLACHDLAGECQLKLKNERHGMDIWNTVERALSKAGKLDEKMLVLLTPDGRNVLLVRDEEMLSSIRQPQSDNLGFRSSK